jgi:aspartate/methionine/tyrosine aminotransferase
VFASAILSDEALMSFPSFAYLGWVRRYQSATRFPLTYSGVSWPPSTLFSAVFSGDLPWLRESVLQEQIGSRFGVPASSVVPCAGTSAGVFLSLAALLSPGDVVAVESHTYELLQAVPRALRAELVEVRRVPEADYTFDLDSLRRALARRPRVFVFANPHNPSGTMLTAEQLREVIGLCLDAGCLVLVDEVYLPFVEGARSAFFEGAITVCSPTKATGLGDLRSGWVLAPPAIADKIRDAADVAGSYVSQPSLQLLSRALGTWEVLVARGRRLAWEGFGQAEAFVASQPALCWARPVAGMTGFVRLANGRSAARFVETLRTEYETGVVPGEFFGDPSGFRLCFGLLREESLGVLEEGLSRIAAALAAGEHEK